MRLRQKTQKRLLENELTETDDELMKELLERAKADAKDDTKNV